MCGIAGSYHARIGATAGRIQAMTDRLIHRGPDDEGFALIDTASKRVWDGKRAQPSGTFDLALGHRRLSILDVSDAGHQPMPSADGRYWIVFNGEIYNYVELREQLAKLGHMFRSGSDTEVLLAAYAEWGTDCLPRFNGMWAFAIWDVEKRELFCARDRFGVKPLYYAVGPDWFVFGSEIKALFANRFVPRAPNDELVYDFLALRYVDHTDDTFFAGVHKLPAAHWMIYRPGERPAPQRFWALATQTRIESSPKEDVVAIERFRELFEDAVRVRLRSDVPLGTCLSGGLDSSSIVVTANRLMFDELALDPALVGDRQRTFSACFEDGRFDEREFIDHVILQTGASSRRTFPSSKNLWRELPRMLAHMDEPFHSTSQYSQYEVMRLARESGVTVTLDGQGADELLGGYTGYHSVYLATLLRANHPMMALREARATLKMGGRGRTASELLLRTSYGKLPAWLTTPLRTAAAPLMSSVSPEGRSLGVLAPEFRRHYAARRDGWLSARSEVMHDVGAKLGEDLFQFSLPCLLRYADRNSMAASIESRMPLLDYRLAEHVASLPLSLLLRDGWTKWILRRAMDHKLPAEVQWRKDKKGFVTPEGLWLREGRTQIADVLGGTLASHAYLDGGVLRERVARYVDSTNQAAYYTDVFRWYIVESWMQYAFGSASPLSSTVD